MCKFRIGFILVIILFVLPILVVGQKIRFYNSEHGLPNSLIHKIFQDDKGYIWIATENGAGYFDGLRFTTFHHEQNKPGTISSDLVKVIYTDNKNVCWVGTSNGLQIFDRKNNIFRDFPSQYPSFTGTFYVNSIIESDDHNKLLVSVAGFGIAVYDENTHLIDIETTEKLKHLYKNNYLGNLFLDSGNSLWSYSEQGSFFKINFKTKTIDKIHWSKNLEELSEKIVVSALTEDPITHNIIIGTYNHGILIFDRSIGFIRRPKGVSSSKYRIRSLLAENKKRNNDDLNIWVGSEDSGLKMFDRYTEEIINPDFQYAPIDLDNCKVHSIIQDLQGNIWAGIFQKGMLLIPQVENDFQYIKLAESKGSINANVACATSVTRDKSGNLWVGTDGGGLFLISKNGTKTHYTKDNTPLPNNAILTLTNDNHGNIWISTYMGGMTTYNPDCGFKAYDAGVELQKVNCSLYDNRNDKLYFGTLGYGVWVLSFSDNKLKPLSQNNSIKWVSTLCLDIDGILWVGHTDGVSSFNPVTGEELKNELSNQLNGISIGSSLEDLDGTIWFGSTKGLYHYFKKTNELVKFSKDNGLPNNFICAIQQDDDRNLWISTNNGLSNLNTKTKIFKNYYAYDGLQDNEFRMKTSYKDADGKLFFGGINGISAFYPNKIKGEEKLTSKISFSQLNVLNQSVNFDETLGKKNILDKHISEANQITLRNNQNVFSLEFTVLEYANPQKVVYAYMLKGFDKDWRYTNANNRSATYTNLPEGSYLFTVKAYFEGNTNPKNEVYNDIKIRILPPWYKSWWAYLIYLAIFMITVWQFSLFLINRKIRIKEQAELQKKELKLKMFTDLTHEIRTPFSLVMSPLKSMLESEKDIKRKDMFDLMYRNVLRILRLLNQLMDVRKIDNKQFVLHFKNTNIIFFIQDLMKSFDQLAFMRNIDFRLVSNLDSLDIFIDEANFDKVLFNLLSNAFKFTPDNGYIMITLNKFKNNPHEGLGNKIEEYAEISIENSGENINHREIERIFDRFYQSIGNSSAGGSGIGLHLAKMIVDLHHGKIKAKNTEKGVVFTIQIPLGKKHLSQEQIFDPNLTLNTCPGMRSGEMQSPDKEVFEIPAKYNDAEIIKSNKANRSLIFIDDDEELGRYIRMELSEMFHVEVCATAKEAWKSISTTIPDAVITDLIMPEVDGIWLCRKIRQSPDTYHLPIIILTSSDDEQSEQTCIDSGADHYLIKPVNIELLKSTVANAIRTRELLRNKYKSNVNIDFNGVEMSSPDSRLIAKVIETVRKNIENSEFGVDDLSREVGYSRVHINRKLKENLNISPGNLIKSIRMKQAAYLLINNKLNVSDVAYKLGFCSHSYFSNSFKEYFGMSPKEFIMKYDDAEENDIFNRLFETNMSNYSTIENQQG